ncbi:MAG: SGNH/GDSL hydrolase family protein [Gemmatimonadetes bacterium]|nr:SGNH/GDSL hydrolase family protein [Gemmatimonadota bacterium]
MTAPRWARRTSAVLTYVLLLLLILEAASRVALSNDRVFYRIKGWDEASSRLQWVRRRNAGERFGYKFDKYHPTRGWTLWPGLRDVPVFDGRILNSNSRGLRGRTEYTYDRDPSRRRILVFGDSYTFGDDVSDEETYSHFLEQLLPDTDVLNMGEHGYGQDQMLLYLREEGIKYHPDVVILGYVRFDTYRNIFTFNSYAKPKFELVGGALHLTHVPVPAPQALMARERYRSKALDLVTMVLERIRWATGINERRMGPVSRAVLDGIAETARQAGAVPVFVYLPALGEVADTTPGATANERFLTTWCAERGARCLFLRRRFAEAVARGEAIDTVQHWRANGHRLVAEGIRDYLVAEGLLPPRSVQRPKGGTAITPGRARPAAPAPASTTR